MSMKRILGMMLASRMAGRGGLGGAGLGGLAAGGLLGGRRGGFGRKAGLATLGYMAYRAYQDHQARSGASGQASGRDDQAGRAAGTGGIGDVIGGLVKSVGDALGGGQGAQTDLRAAGVRTGAGIPPEASFTAEDEAAAENFSEDKALLLVRAMVTAANADGSISAEERARITRQAEAAGADSGDRHALERELANPRPLDELLAQVRDPETGEAFYLASRMAIDDATEAHRAYLARLRERLGLGPSEASEIETLAG